jgi:hypothetical protein
MGTSTARRCNRGSQSNPSSVFSARSRRRPRRLASAAAASSRGRLQPSIRSTPGVTAHQLLLMKRLSPGSGFLSPLRQRRTTLFFGSTKPNQECFSRKGGESCASRCRFRWNSHPPGVSTSRHDDPQRHQELRRALARQDGKLQTKMREPGATALRSPFVRTLRGERGGSPSAARPAFSRRS